MQWCHWWWHHVMQVLVPTASFNTSTHTSGVTWTQKSCDLVFIILTLQMQWYYLWCFLYYMILMLASMASHDQRSCTLFQLSWLNKCNGATDIISFTGCQHSCWWCHMIKGNVAPYFDCLDLLNVMVLWTMPLKHAMLTPAPMVSHDQRVMLHFVSIVLT